LVLIVSAVTPVLPVTAISPIVQVEPDIIYRSASLTTVGIPPYTPNEIRQAYSFTNLYSLGINGTGTRIAIVDAYGSSSLSSDLTSFDSLTGLPAATVNSYFPDGVPRQSNSGWALETSLDVEWSHAMAPSATIDLVVAVSSSIGSIYDAILFVANSLPNDNVVSMSFGQSESLYPTTGTFTIAGFHQLFVTMTSHGTTPVASSGDSGASSCCNVQYPASDPLVLAVGGTSLAINPNGSYGGEAAWSGGGAGSSLVFSKPSFQQGLGDSMRDIVDISYDADVNTGVLVISNGGQFQVGGTSVGAPQWASLLALSDQAGSTTLGVVAYRLYKLASYHDVTSGSNGFFSATIGWDYPTGLGSPNATSTVMQLTQSFKTVLTGNSTFQGVNVVTNGTITVSPLILAISGSAMVTATNTTSHMVLFSKTYTLPALTLFSRGGMLQTSFLLNIRVLPYLLSSDVNLVLHGASLSASVLVTRQIDIDGNGMVDFLDASTLAIAYGSSIGSPSYNPRADLQGTGKVTFIDASILGFFYQAPNLI
jgi:subtilase family serine protease